MNVMSMFYLKSLIPEPRFKCGAAVIGGALAGGGALLSGLFGAAASSDAVSTNVAENEKNRRFNSEEAEKARGWQTSEREASQDWQSTEYDRRAESQYQYWLKQNQYNSPVEQAKRVAKEKQNILDFLTGAENSGKTWFSNFYVTPDGKEQHEVVVTRIDSSKEGGDWETDVQEAVNMICFTLQVHSNLVGSVPGKSQTNNSGSDKRELYTIAQALQKPYHDLMFVPHNVLIRFNGWKGVKVRVPFIKLTTLDENTDAKLVTLDNQVG